MLSIEVNAGVSDPTVTISAFRLQQLELDAERARRLQARIDELTSALQIEQARSERHADVLVQVARSSDDRAREMELQHAAAIAAKDAMFARVEAAKDAVIASKEREITDLKSNVAALEIQVASKLTEIHAAVAALRTLEIYPARPTDSRQFAAWHNGPVPPLPLPPHLASVAVHPATFDRAWAAEAANGATIQFEAGTDTRIRVKGGRGGFYRTFRSAAPLPRGLAATAAQHGQQQPPQLQAYRVVIEAFGRNDRVHLGFIPGDASFIEDGDITRYGGWYLSVGDYDFEVQSPLYSGWVALLPKMTSGAGARGGGAYSAFATTEIVPPAPLGSAVEFAVDYTAGTCRVAFYTPKAVAGGFMDPPYAQMELRFVATDAVKENRGRYIRPRPARSVPTTADSGVELYPAVSFEYAGAALRFLA